jgi:hypothetical protein
MAAAVFPDPAGACDMFAVCASCDSKDGKSHRQGTKRWWILIRPSRGGCTYWSVSMRDWPAVAELKSYDERFTRHIGHDRVVATEATSESMIATGTAVLSWRGSQPYSDAAWLLYNGHRLGAGYGVTPGARPL